jgi:hypothetical protein
VQAPGTQISSGPGLEVIFDTALETIPNQIQRQGQSYFFSIRVSGTDCPKKSGLLFFSDAVCGLNSIRGREILYPQPFGKVTAGADKDDPMDRRVQEYRRYHEGFGDILFQIN